MMKSSYYYKNDTPTVNNFTYDLRLEDRNSTFNLVSVKNTSTNTYLNPRMINNLKFESFRKLNDGWDGYNSPKIQDDVINNAFLLHEKLNCIPEIYPTGRNSIQFEYHLPDNLYVEIAGRQQTW